MKLDLDKLFEHTAFATLEPEQTELFREFAVAINSKGPLEIMRLYMQMSQSVNRIRPLEASERDAIVAAIGEALTPAEKAKMNSFLKLMGNVL